jgi:micrococcal nuclease
MLQKISSKNLGYLVAILLLSLLGFLLPELKIDGFNLPSFDLEQLLVNEALPPSEEWRTATELPPADPASASPSGKTDQTKATVARIIDGDTIELNDGRKLRYIGIDTPETVHPTKGVECFGVQASQKNSQLVLGKEVILEKDVSETDRYGRLLRYVYLASESGQVFVNHELVKTGYAQASSYPPDIKYQDQLRAAEAEAMENQLGLWGADCQI